MNTRIISLTVNLVVASTGRISCCHCYCPCCDYCSRDDVIFIVVGCVLKLSLYCKQKLAASTLARVVIWSLLTLLLVVVFVLSIVSAVLCWCLKVSTGTKGLVPVQSC